MQENDEIVSYIKRAFELKTFIHKLFGKTENLNEKEIKKDDTSD